MASGMMRGPFQLFIHHCMNVSCAHTSRVEYLRARSSLSIISKVYWYKWEFISSVAAAGKMGTMSWPTSWSGESSECEAPERWKHFVKTHKAECYQLELLSCLHCPVVWQSIASESFFLIWFLIADRENGLIAGSRGQI